MKQDEVFASTFEISNKEKELKQRFLNNQRALKKEDPKPAQPILSPPESHLHTFLNDMQSAMRQQTTGTLAGELLKRQNDLMHQQMEMLQTNQKDLHTLIQTIATKPDRSDDSRRFIAEMMAPLNRQILDVKAYYEETKTLARDIGMQVQQMKEGLERGGLNDNLRKSVEQNMQKFSATRHRFSNKVQEAENLVDEVIENTKDKVSLDNCTQGVMYLKQQIEAVRTDTEAVENELQNRFKRIMESCVKMKNMPREVLYPGSDFTGASERVKQYLGGEFDYWGILEEMDELKRRRAILEREWRSNTPVYPKVPKLQEVAYKKEQEIYKPVKASETKKYAEMQPVHTEIQKKTLTKKPDSLYSVATKPLAPPPIPHSKKPKKSLKSRKKPKHILHPTPQDIAPKLEEEYHPKPAPTPIPKQSITTQTQAETSLSPPSTPPEPVSMPAPSEPLPFQTKPGYTKGSQTILKPEDLVSKEYLPKTVETQEPPINTIEQKTVDIVTDFILAKMLGSDKSINIEYRGGAARWLGVEEISGLIKEGIYVDADTVDKIGREVLSNEIANLKKKPTQPSVSLIDLISEPIIEERRPEVPVKNESIEDEYEEDFEDEEDKHIESYNSESKVFIQPALSDRIQPNPKFEDLPKPARFDHPPDFSRSQIIQDQPTADTTIPANELSSLLNPRMLGMMSAAAVQHYVSALIESGHIGRSSVTENRTPTPNTLFNNTMLQTPRLPTPANKPEPKPAEKIEQEPTMPDEISKFFGSGMGSRLLDLIKSDSSANPQQILEKFARSYLAPAKPGVQFLKVDYPPEYEERKQNPKEEDIFGKIPPPGSKPRYGFDLDAEENKLHREQLQPRRMIDIPLFKPEELLPPISIPVSSPLSLTDSEMLYSSGSSSVGSEIFSIENPEFIGGFMDFIRKTRHMDDVQIGNGDLSEGEVALRDTGRLSSGEVPKEMLNSPGPAFSLRTSVNHDRISFGDLLSVDEEFEKSEGEFDPASIFSV